jgi:hypothetical protein
MCACDFDYVCSQHRDTPEDHSFVEYEAPEPVYAEEEGE